MTHNFPIQMVEIDQNPFAVAVQNGKLSVNLTQLAKPFGKRVNDWLSTRTAKEYLEAMSRTRKTVLTDLLTVNNGGLPDERGTWAHDHNIVIQFAYWLNPDYSIKVNDFIFKVVTGELRVFNPSDFETGVLPKLAHYRDIFMEGFFYDYIELLKACGLSVSSGSVRRRKRKNPQEFRTAQDGLSLVSERYGKAIFFNAVAAKFNVETRIRRLDYEQQKALA